jgi:hypothetical protein
VQTNGHETLPLKAVAIISERVVANARIAWINAISCEDFCSGSLSHLRKGPSGKKQYVVLAIFPKKIFKRLKYSLFKSCKPLVRGLLSEGGFW